MTADGPLVVVGDALLDVDIEGRVERVCPDAPVPVVDQHRMVERPGGAGLAALLAAVHGEGRPVVLVTALAGDEAGHRLARLLAERGVEVVDLGAAGATAEKVRVRASGQSLLRLDRGSAAGRVGPPTAAARAALTGAAAVVVADYGRGVTAEPSLRAALVEVAAGRPLVWDPHPNGTAPVAGTLVATPNLGEAERVLGDAIDLTRAAGGAGAADGRRLALKRAERAATELRRRWPARAVAVTMGASGALLVADPGPPLVAPPSVVSDRDPCGAGDRLATSLGLLLAAGAVLSEALPRAVDDAARFVATGGLGLVTAPPAPPPASSTSEAVTPEAVTHEVVAAGPGWRDAAAVVERVRAEGGTVVATGGCFDLLHAGHVSLLERARRLGDALVVCINSDESVRRLKGDGRPVVPAADRARVLAALASVDAVAVFDDDTPARVLRTLRPDVFAKGGDYSGTALPESEVVAAWDGQAVVLPYLAGRSTTHLISELHAPALDAAPPGGAP